MRIMVTGAGGSAGYNVTKCLMDAGHFVLGVDTDEMMIHLSPADATSTRGRPDWAELVGQFKIDFLLPQPEEDVRWLAATPADEYLPHLMPPSETVELCADKLKLADYLADLAPASFQVPGTDTLIDQLLERHNWSMWLRAKRGAGAYAALGPVGSLRQVQGHIDWWVQKSGDVMQREDFMLSEYLPGDEYTWQGVYRGGVKLGEFARQRVTRMIKQGFSGTPSVARSTMKPDVLEVGREVADRLKWHTGVIGVDMRANSMGVLKVTEVNTRFYTTTLFPAALGNNLPHALVSGAGWLLPYEEDRLWIRQPDAGYRLV